MERLPTWVSLFGLSIVIMAAALDQFNGVRGGRENYIIATAVLSLIISFIFIAANLVDKLGNLIVGNVIENAFSGIVVGLWTVAIAFIQNPKNATATAINNAGQEIILYANMYFFSWLNYIAAIYLFGNVIRDNFAFNPKFSLWVLLLAASVVLTSTSVSLHEDICSKVEETVCGRLKYATAVGALGITFSLISIIATMLGYMKKIMEIGSSFLVCVFFFFGVVTLTTASGPASTLGNMYFSVWGGCFCAFSLLVGAAFPDRGQSQANNSHQQAQHQDMDDQL